MDVSQTIFDEYADDLGHEKMIHIYEPVSKLKSIVVIDNVAAGPTIGGVRMAPDLTTTEIRGLARAMTFKNAAAGLPHDGAKAGIMADPKTSNKEHLILHHPLQTAIKLELTRRLGKLPVKNVAMEPPSGKLFIGKSLMGYQHFWR